MQKKLQTVLLEWWDFGLLSLFSNIKKTKTMTVAPLVFLGSGSCWAWWFLTAKHSICNTQPLKGPLWSQAAGVHMPGSPTFWLCELGGLVAPMFSHL